MALQQHTHTLRIIASLFEPSHLPRDPDLVSLVQRHMQRTDEVGILQTQHHEGQTPIVQVPSETANESEREIGTRSVTETEIGNGQGWIETAKGIHTEMLWTSAVTGLNAREAQAHPPMIWPRRTHPTQQQPAASTASTIETSPPSTHITTIASGREREFDPDRSRDRDRDRPSERDQRMRAPSSGWGMACVNGANLPMLAGTLDLVADLRRMTLVPTHHIVNLDLVPTTLLLLQHPASQEPGPSARTTHRRRARLEAGSCRLTHLGRVSVMSLLTEQPMSSRKKTRRSMMNTSMPTMVRSRRLNKTSKRSQTGCSTSRRQQSRPSPRS